MKTQVVKFKDTHAGDVLKFDRGYFEVKIDVKGDKLVKGAYFSGDRIMERVITKNPLVRLKRYLVG